MESKRALEDFSEEQLRLLIEPVWNRNKGNANQELLAALPFNRTSMESKQAYEESVRADGVRTFNRTSMESKLF